MLAKNNRFDMPEPHVPRYASVSGCDKIEEVHAIEKLVGQCRDIETLQSKSGPMDICDDVSLRLSCRRLTIRQVAPFFLPTRRACLGNTSAEV
jgi:hypothetical protein